MNKEEKHLIDEEQAYPIYSVEIKWIQDAWRDSKEEDKNGWNKGVPEGRMRNGTGWFKMFREEKAIEELVEEAKQRFIKMVERKNSYKEETNKILNPSEPEITVKFVRYETWSIGWFDHWTFDNGQTDQEVLKSFEKFVRRMEDLNKRESKFIKTGKNTGYYQDAYCLMGAEDRYRWCGLKNPDSDERTDPPCRCTGCKEQGVIRIIH